MMAVKWALRGPILMCLRSCVWRGRDLRWGALSLRSSQTLLGMGLRVRETGAARGRPWGPWGPTGPSQVVRAGSSGRC